MGYFNDPKVKRFVGRVMLFVFVFMTLASYMPSNDSYARSSEADVEVLIQEVNVEATSQGHVVGQAEVEAQDVAATKEDALSLSTAKSVIHQAVTKQKKVFAQAVYEEL